MLKYLAVLVPLMLVGVGCDINHNLSGDAYVHVVADKACDYQESVGGSVVICADGRELSCVATDTDGVFVCQRTETAAGGDL